MASFWMCGQSQIQRIQFERMKSSVVDQHLAMLPHSKRALGLNLLVGLGPPVWSFSVFFFFFGFLLQSEDTQARIIINYKLLVGVNGELDYQ